MRHFVVSALPKLWETIRYSYWVIPAVMTLGALGLGFALLELDRAEQEGLVERLRWVYGGGSDGAREVLSVIVGSMITVAGVVFSITMVALTLASSQFGPRVLRNFMQDRGNQIVLGTFLATIVFSLIVLRTIEGGDEEFVPQLSVTASVVMALGSLGILIYFIHHVTLSIQASEIVATIGKEMLASIDHVFPERGNDRHAAVHPGAHVADEEDPPGVDAHFIAARATGYLQSIDRDSLIHDAREADVLLEILCRPGDFISPYKPLLLLRPAFRWNDDLSDGLLDAFATGKERSHAQDVLFAVDQLVEVAVRALSPGVNDPFTAIRCLDWLGAGLSRCLMRAPAPSARTDKDGRLRLIWHPVTFEDVAASALLQIQEYGSRSASVTLHVLEVIRDVGRHARAEEDRVVLRRHARQVLKNSEGEILQHEDRKRVKSLYNEAIHVIDGKIVATLDEEAS